MFSLPNFSRLNQLPLGSLAIAVSTFLILIVIFHNTNLVFSTPQVVLQIVSPEKSDMYQLFYDTGKDFNETESVRYAVDKGEGIKDVIFGLPVPLDQVKSIRIDPGSQPTLIKIKSIQLTSAGKEYHWNATEILQNFRPAMYIDNFSEKEGLLYVSSTGIDPAFVSIVNFNTLFEDNLITPIHLSVYLLIAVISVIISIFLSKTMSIAKTKIDGTLSKILVISFAAIIFTVLFYVIFSPPFLSFDSYHYMVLSFYPAINDSHPLGFGFILRLISIIAVKLWDNAFVHLFILFNILCFFSIGWIILKEINHHITISLVQRILSTMLIISAIFFIVPALFFLINGFWTEMTSFLLIVLISFFLSREYVTHSKLNIIFVVLLSLLAYHVRYQLIILPVALIGVAVICYMRGRFLNFFPLFLKWSAIAISVFFLIPVSNYLASCFMSSSNNANYAKSMVVQTSIQCRLKCEISLFEKDCNTAESKQLVIDATCTDLVHGVKSLGSSKLGVVSVPAILKEIGFKNTMIWIIKSPLTFLREKHYHLEYEMFKFDKNIRQLGKYYDVMEYYGNLIKVEDQLTGGSTAFNQLIQWIRYAYFELSAYHVLTAVIVLTSLIIMCFSPNPTSIFLALVCIGNFLVFSYLNPHAPLRYLMQIMVPGIMSLLVSLTYHLKWELTAKS